MGRVPAWWDKSPPYDCVVVRLPGGINLLMQQGHRRLGSASRAVVDRLTPDPTRTPAPLSLVRAALPLRHRSALSLTGYGYTDIKVETSRNRIFGRLCLYPDAVEGSSRSATSINNEQGPECSSILDWALRCDMLYGFG